ncbi:uncharacterized protein C11orf97 homolog isoform X2 [Passer domesticus]|uniref:uncharacterized protein C11orf97 homolog isoform X2 n=1 Tax=Passer domesticus TaxID=48849 RepID=UPI0030FF24EC
MTHGAAADGTRSCPGAGTAPPAGQPGNARGAARPTPAAAAMRAAAGEPGSEARGEQPRQKCVYVEPPRRVKEILEEHFHLQKEECNINHPAAAVWTIRDAY